MRFFRTALVAFFSVLGVLVLLAVLAMTLGYFGVIVFFVIMSVYGWVLFSFVHYRSGRQDELVQVLITAAESDAPLSSALWAYVLDRPQGNQRELWVATILFFVLPGYYWIWHRQNSFDRKLAKLAHLLEHGVPLAVALRDTPGVASADTRLAVAVGKATNQLAPCLRSLRGRRVGVVWLEVIPRLLYPLALLLTITSIASFLTIYIIPKYEKIYADFGLRLPRATTLFMEFTRSVSGYLWIVPLVLLTNAALIAILFASTTVRWFFPVVGRYYRSQVRSRVLNMLALLLEGAMPAPKALAFLAVNPAFGGIAGRRLSSARFRVENGEPLVDSLARSGLLARNAVPLAHAAERTHTLPWALKQLGDNLAGRAVRFVRQLSLVFTPLSVVLVGALVAFIALAIFWPLVQVLMALT